jgi:hypothetical protein
MIVCLRTVDVPAAQRTRYRRGSPKDAAPARRTHPRRARPRTANGDGDTVVVTIWPRHDVFDSWIATPQRDRLTASAGHQAVDHHPITRYEIAAGYLNLPALAAQPDTYPTTEDTS